eukprot:GHUV01050824.1.p1 GENE.GHUV01050824.1~~GHUV01050824.1.p1  ORF type:complete len:122 (-),score=20.22 GHUV01050824.1:20-385(-)
MDILSHLRWHLTAPSTSAPSCIYCDLRQATQESPKRELLAELSLPANAGRAFGALTGDRNPIHMHALTSQLFGFKKPIAHAMYIVSRLEAELAKKGKCFSPPVGMHVLLLLPAFAIKSHHP